jgi:integrase
MAKGFTDLEIQNAKATDTRREIPDPGCAGLYLIVQPSGKKSFAVRYRNASGNPRKLTLTRGVTLRAARKAAADALYEVEQGRDPAETKKEARATAKKTKANTVQRLCESYLAREGDKLRTKAARERELKRLVYPAIGSTPLNKLRRSDIVEMLDDIEDKCGTKNADLILAYVRRIFNWHAGRVDDFNSPIVPGMGRYDARANQGTRVLSDDEIRAIWKATEPDAEKPQPFHALVRFLLLTGARREEARALAWSEIDGSTWSLPAARNKTKLDLTRPLSKTAQAVLKDVPRIDGARLVFTYNGAIPISLTKPTELLKKVSGTNGWRLHDFRRTTRTLLSRAGVDADVAERCLGHTIQGTRSVYDKHNYQPEMASAYEALAALIDLIINPSANVVSLRAS